MDPQDWHLTILLLEGLRLMRPEKAWRPIVTVEVDGNAGAPYETLLGVDGQCVNQREGMQISEASPTSKLEIKVWHRSQSKKKKRRILVASACYQLSELQKLHDSSIGGKLDIRLQCRTPDQKNVAARGRPQKGAVLKMRLRPPLSSYPSNDSSSSTLVPSEEPRSAGPSRGSTLDTQYTDDSRMSVSGEEKEPLLKGMEEVSSPTGSDSEDWHNGITIINDDVPDLINDIEPLPHLEGLRRRRPRKKVKPYPMYTDDECPSVSVSASESESEFDSLLSPSQAQCDESINSGTFVDDDDDLSLTPHQPHKHPLPEDLVFRAASGEIEIISLEMTGPGGVREWIATARDVLLPQYTEKIKIRRTLTRTESVLAAFTLYAELSCAEKEEEFDPVFRRLRSEWVAVGTVLLGLAGVNTALFTISSDSMFTVGDYAKAAIATSSVSSGLGIACTAWFFLRYNWADTPTIIERSRDLFESHFFFALSARVPALCMFTSSCALTACLALIAFSTFPQGVLILCFLVGVLMSLQFIVFGVSWAAKHVVQGGKMGGEKVKGAVRRVTRRGGEPVAGQS